MDKLANYFALIMGTILIAASVFAKTEIQDLRVTSFPQNTRVIFDLSGSAKYKVFTLEKPDRIVIDIDQAQLKTKLNNLNFANTEITNIRYSHQNQKLRVVFDLHKKIKPNAFLLNPDQTYGNRLVIDFPHQEKLKEEAVAAVEHENLNSRDNENVNTRKFIVAIDPGHGGKDSGAVGRYRHVKEKDVVFKVANKLQSLINAQPGMHAFLIRSGDYYVDLRKRMALAREKGADLFISVHADSFKDLRASGASVFVLSEKGASSEAARWLAERENSSDLVGGVKLEDKGALLASVLIDLSQTASQSASHELANHLIANLAKVTDLHHRTVQSAGFMVLKSPDIPSVLVELGFISNQQGEEKLLNSSHQQVLANALLSGIKTYAAKRPPPAVQPDWTVAQR